MAEADEKITVREAVFLMRNFSHCIEGIVKMVDDNTFKNNLFMGVSYPLRELLKGWDEWHDLEKGLNILNNEKKTF